MLAEKRYHRNQGTRFARRYWKPLSLKAQRIPVMPRSSRFKRRYWKPRSPRLKGDSQGKRRLKLYSGAISEYRCRGTFNISFNKRLFINWFELIASREIKTVLLLLLCFYSYSLK
jgi:hypothetical protein